MDISGAIRKRRLAIKLSQQELGERIGVGRSHVCGLEKDGHLPSIRTLMAVAWALNTDAWRLVREAEKESAK